MLCFYIYNFEDEKPLAFYLNKYFTFRQLEN